MKRNTKIKLYIFIFLFLAVLFIMTFKLGLSTGVFRQASASQQIRSVPWGDLWNSKNEIIFDILFMTASLILLIELVTYKKK